MCADMEKELVIVIDDDICPINKANFNFIDLPDNVVGVISDKLEIPEYKYKEYKLDEIENELSNKGLKLESYIVENDFEEFRNRGYLLKHPKEFSASDMAEEIKKNNCSRNFIILDKLMDKAGEEASYAKLKEYLDEIIILMKDYYTGIVFYSSDAEEIKSIDDAMTFLNDIGIEDKIEELAIHVNFVDKGTANVSESIKSAFVKSQNSNLLNLYEESYQETINKMKESIWDINNNKALIHYDYLMEGQHIDDIFYEIYKNKFDKIYKKKCSEKVETYINPVRRAVQEYEGKFSYEEIDIIREKIFLYRSIKELNNLFKEDTYISECKKNDDVKFGDIFEINGEHYMVITQDCDLCVRMEDKDEEIADNICLVKVEYSDECVKNGLIVDSLKEIYKHTYKCKPKNKKKKPTFLKIY